jgi:ribose 5-phosphate isomerase A
MPYDDLKQQAALAAVKQVQSGMVVGLGFGSTAIHALREIGFSLQEGILKDVSGIPTAESIAQAAMDAGIPLTSLEQSPIVDITIDGADEVDPALNLIKGGGGALLREKIVAQASRKLIIVVDESKLSDRLGTKFKLPVEVLPFGWGSQKRYIEGIGAQVFLRMEDDNEPFMTDAGNLILDCDFGGIKDLEALATKLEKRAGIVEHGLFLNLASEVIVGTQSGIRTLTRQVG